MSARYAKAGSVYVCGACGKKSKDLYGEGGGWDESCMLNAVLCNEVTGEVIEGTRRPLKPMPTFEEILATPIDPELLECAQELLRKAKQ